MFNVDKDKLVKIVESCKEDNKLRMYANELEFEQARVEIAEMVWRNLYANGKCAANAISSVSVSMRDKELVVVFSDTNFADSLLDDVDKAYRDRYELKNFLDELAWKDYRYERVLAFLKRIDVEFIDLDVLFAMEFGGDTLAEICQQFTEGQAYLESKEVK
jgi:ATP phosphoribosyltransferase regulatory subunit HisZ